MATRALATADELLALPDDGMRHELVEGEITTMTPAGYEHGRIAFRVAMLLGRYLEQNPIGDAFGAETGFWIGTDPDTVRAPDAAFVARNRIAEVSTRKGFGRGAPDLVAEVVSPSDSYEEVDRKVQQWLAAGTRLVWVVSPATRSVTAYAPDFVRLLGESDSLDGGDVLPGFSCPVAEVFG